MTRASCKPLAGVLAALTVVAGRARDGVRGCARGSRR